MTKPFTVIVPVKVNDSNLVTTNVPETDYPVYNAGTTYALGARVIVTTGYHNVYQSVVAGNTGHFPPTSATYWVLVGPTNAHAAFDESGGTLTSLASPLEFKVSGDLMTAIGLIELSASMVRIRAYSAGEGTYYDQTFDLEDRAVVGDWFAYFFAEIDKQSQLIVTDIPPVSGSEYTITITGPSTVAVGTFVLGKASEFGFTEYNAQVGIIDYSRKEVNEFGRASLEERAFRSRMSVSIWVNRGVVDSVKKKLSGLRAKNCLWVAASEQYEALTIFGFFRDFSIDIAYPTHSICTAEFEGISS